MNFNNIVNNVNKVYTITKLNFKLEVMNQKLLNLYAKLGLLTYNLSLGMDVSEDIVNGTLEEIKLQKQQIAINRSEIKKLK